METKKLREKLHEIKTQNFTDSHSSSKEKKNKKTMQMGTEKKIVTKKTKTRKSKHNEVSSDNSKKSESIVRKRARYSDMYDDIEARFSVMERADKLLASIVSKTPNFIKCMLPSNVSHGFWLHLPRKFCDLHLPKHDSTIVLVDEWGNEYKTSYLLERNGLSAGWKGFSVSHRLLKGDILIFLLVEPFKLKVHIVRVNSSDVMDAALCLMNLYAHGRGIDPDLVKKDNKKRKKATFVDPFVLVISTPPESVHSQGKNTPKSVVEPVTNQSESSSNGFRSEIL
ncbi:B3 domain-containing protein At5g42700-like isoform X2 [Olea europaea var. sylvestris]|uniref:B3 domain-containing protein At5g42700-like isoform X2 n=1 Tax=Olea europaea var. sylvestris TaxID=158386 RepID=UPI000C1D2152|nr:B3 domain-containing protein At5g42700-like isoform X2 [Olea europaea var. sylvestris]